MFKQLITDTTLPGKAYSMPSIYECLKLFRDVIIDNCLNKHHYKHLSLSASLKAKYADVFYRFDLPQMLGRKNFNWLTQHFNKKDWFVIKIVILKQIPLIWKIFPLERGINTYLLVKQKKYFIEWMSEVSILIVNVEQEKTPKTCLYCSFSWTSVLDIRK